MSTTDRRPGTPRSGPGGAQGAKESVRAVLDRPLASYQLVLGSTGLLLGLGLLMVMSASSIVSIQVYGNSFGFAGRQLALAAVGLVGGLVVMRMKMATLRRLILPALVASVLLLAATFIPGVGTNVNGNTNWIEVGAGFRVQPSEFVKLTLALWIADLYARRHRKLGQPRLVLMPMVLVAGACAALVVAQRDLGTALVLFSLIVGMLWVAGLPGRYLGAVMAGVVVLCVFFVATAPHRVARLLSVWDPMASPDKDGYQVIHAMMGFARGGFGGVGLGGSRQKWGALPEAHTDFILAVIGEELGLLGSLVVLVLFVLLAIAGVRIATRSVDPFARFAAAGITIWIMAQAAINIGMVLGLLPVIGIPLPLLSYGGSSVLTTLVGAAVLLKCATTEPGAQRALDAAKARRAHRTAARRR